MQTFDHGLEGIQLQLKVYPSEDGKWVLVDYLVHNKNSVPKKIQVATSTDIQLGGRKSPNPPSPSTDPADASKLVVNKRGFHMVNNDTKQTFELMFNNPDLGLTEPDSKWVGLQDDRPSNRYADSPHESEGVDSALAYSWTLDLGANQTQTRRVAFGVKGSSYYVSANGDDKKSGDYAEPLATIEEAMKRIVASKPGNKAVFIYLQSDYTISKTIEIPQGLNINILSTDYLMDGTPVEDIHTVTRGKELTGPMFEIHDGILKFGSLILDGYKSAAGNSGPMISADGGMVGITSGVTLQNNKVTASGIGSAINISGTADLDFSYGTVTGNETGDRGTVNFDSSGKFTVAGGINIYDNKDAAGEEANVYLPDGKTMVVNGTLQPAGADPSRIGVTTAKVPEVTPGTLDMPGKPGTPAAAAQEINVAVPKPGSSVDASSFANNFLPDKAGLRSAKGTKGAAGSGLDNGKNTVLRKDGYTITFQFATQDGGSLTPEHSKIPIVFGIGDPVTIEPPSADDVKGYKLISTDITQADPPTLRLAGSEGQNPGQITGTMPGQNVIVKYTYRQMKSQIAFETNGGTPATIPPMEGPVGTKVPEEPKVTKEGYTFLGWSEKNEGPASPIFSWPDKYPTPAREIMLYAVFGADTVKKFDYTKEFTDNTGHILFYKQTLPQQYHVEEKFTEAPIKVPGYLWDKDTSSFNPPAYAFVPKNGPTPTGSFDSDGTFHGKMPAGPLKVHFGYKQNPAAAPFNLTVNYVSGGVKLREPYTHPYKAGESVTVDPKDSSNPAYDPAFEHYKITDAQFIKGGSGGETEDGWVSGAQSPPSADNHYIWTAPMPNQDVELTYSFEKIPDDWMDIDFIAPHGHLTSAQDTESLNIPVGTKWSGIQDKLPVYVAWNGYVQDGWYLSGTDTKVTDDTVLSARQTYELRFKPDTITFNYSMKYSADNSSPNPSVDNSIVFLEKPGDHPKQIGDEITALLEVVPGYKWDKAASEAALPTWAPYPGAAPEAIGAFDDNGKFIGHMPGENATVSYKYVVDKAQPPFKLNIQYVTRGGVDLGHEPEADKNAGDPVHAAKKQFANYTCYDAEFVGIKDEGTVKPPKGQPGSGNNFTWDSYMPNQDVTLVFKYRPSSEKQYDLTVQYKDLSVTDTNLQIVKTKTVQRPADIQVSSQQDAPYQLPVGYLSDTANPPTVATSDPNGANNIQFGNGSAQYDWSGIMPFGKVKITYFVKRIPYKPDDPSTHYWGDITYTPGKYGTLTNASDGNQTVSREVKELGTQITAGKKDYAASILLDDANDSRPDAYTWGDVKDKNLVPRPVADSYYQFDGWFVDQNGNGIKDAGEPSYGTEANNSKFYDSITLTASFAEIPASWHTITLKAHGGTIVNTNPYNGNKNQMHVNEGMTWAGIKGYLGGSHAWEHYAELGWFTDADGITHVDENATFGGDATCHYICKPDPQAKFDSIVKHVSANDDNLELAAQDTSQTNLLFKQEVTAEKANIYGYDYDQQASYTDPSEYVDPPDSTPPVKVGEFETDGHFHGSMPPNNLTIIYKYTPQASKYSLRVNYKAVDEAGNETVIHEPTPGGPSGGDGNYQAEKAIFTDPIPLDGYTYYDMKVTGGDKAGTRGGQATYPVQGEGLDANGHWTAKMPNQDVEVTYYYKADAVKRYGITVEYVDDDAPQGSKEKIISSTTLPGKYTVGAQVEGTYVQPYGYTKTPGQDNPEIKLASSWDGTVDIAPTADGWSGHMPPRDITVIYHNKRDTSDPTHPKWADITYKLGNQNLGSLAENPPGVIQSGSDFKASILISDDSTPGAADKAYTLADIKAKGLEPKHNPTEPDLYKFEGWFEDKVPFDGLMDGDETLVKDTVTFKGPVTLTAHFAEIPEAWMNITFSAKEGTAVLKPLEGSQKNPLHLKKGTTWGQIAAAHLVPGFTKTGNYIEKGWYDTATGVQADDATVLQDGHDYQIVCYKDPAIFGTDVKAPEAAGGLDGKGKGKITLYNIKYPDYQYILTDPDGKILSVVLQRSEIQRVEFDGLDPGAHYNVYEAGMSLEAEPGKTVQSLGGVTGQTISEAISVLTPVVDSNYYIYYDAEPEDDAKTKLVILPADPDSDYAVVDSHGNPVIADGSQDGWMAPSKYTSSIQVPGLGYEVDYTVVARPKGRTDIQPADRVVDGNVITTDPVGEQMVTNYIIQTTSGGQIDTVEDKKEGMQQVGADYFGTAHKGNKVTLSAPDLNVHNETFTGWKTTIGYPLGSKDLPFTEYGEDGRHGIQFVMPNTNLVISPVYDHKPNKASPSNASVIGDVRGGNRGEIALDPDPDRTRNLEGNITKQKDRDLMDVNGADITYHVVYHKGKATSDDIKAVKNNNEHSQPDDAFKAAWSLNVGVERYVDGRRVGLASASTATAINATPSSAAKARPSTGTASDADPSLSTASEAERYDAGAGDDSDEQASPYSGIVFYTYVQMGRDDVDMLDYQLFEIQPNGSASVVMPEEVLSEDGGLFLFALTAGNRYVMVYSRAYHVRFINDLPYLPVAQQPYDFKVRRKDRASDYAEYQNVPTPKKEDGNTHLIAKNGIEYNYEDWSYSDYTESHCKPFKEELPIKSTTWVYAYYVNNKAERDKEYDMLKAAIEEGWKLSRDPFMKRQDSQDLQRYVNDAIKILRQEEPRAALESELRTARETLENWIGHYRDLLQKTHDEYDEIKGQSSSGGGSGGGGGGGKGVVKDPFNATPVNIYTVGTNGSWKVVSAEPGKDKELAFVLNGGLALRSMWAKLMFPGKPESNGWYHFNSRAILDTGWFVDEKGKWYYSNKETEGYMGKMATGWHKEALDGRWYYLDPVNGDMATGWKQIEGKWYYLETVGSGTYAYDSVTVKWNYVGGSGHPLGSMYQNEMTPDGYKVDENGAWIQ